MSSDGTKVLQAACECPRGQHVCHHMAALLIKGNKEISSTDSTSKWTQCAPASGAAMSIPQVFPPSKEYCAIKQKPSQSDLDWLKSQLDRKGQSTGVHWLLSEENSFTNSVATVDQVIKAEREDVDVDRDPIDNIFDNLRVSKSEIDWVEEKTREQRKTVFWGMYRKGRITSSNFGVVIDALTKKCFSDSFWKRVMGEYDLDGVKAIQWGIDHEQDALNAYSDVTGCAVIKSGLILHSCGFLGASPDGLVGDKVVEVKCPFSARELNIEQTITSPPTKAGFYLTKDNNNRYILNQSNTQGRHYYHQIQGLLHIANKTVCDFVVWTKKDMVIVTISKDSHWESNISQLKLFYKKHYLPKLLGN